jgi:hypothetical protein
VPLLLLGLLVNFFGDILDQVVDTFDSFGKVRLFIANIIGAFISFCCLPGAILTV